MANWPIQTKNTIKMLKQAGLKRSDFRVRTPVNKYGEYEHTEITLLSKGRHTNWSEVAEALKAADLYVARYFKADGTEYSPSVYYTAPSWFSKSERAARESVRKFD